MPKPATVLTEFVLEQLPTQPSARRIQLTRALAEISTGKERNNLLMVAALLEDVEANHRQFVMDFKRRHGA